MLHEADRRIRSGGMITSSRGRWASITAAVIACGSLACNPADEGPSSVPTPFGPDTTAPTFAGIKRATPTSETEVQVSWDAATDDLTKKVEAGKLVGEVAKAVGGKGGGRKDLAQAGGSEPAKLGDALALARKLATEKLA